MKQFIDNGNGRYKGMNDTGRKAKMISIVGSGFRRKHSMPQVVKEEEEYMSTENLHVSVLNQNGTSQIATDYFVGRLARAESKDGERVYNMMDFNDERVQVAIATMSALLNPRNKELDRLCIGLPLGLYNEKKEHARQAISNMNMEVSFVTGGVGAPLSNILVKPKEVRVYPQCGAGLFNCLFDLSGKLKPGITPGLYAGVDIGWGTTDMMVVEIHGNGSVEIRGDMTDTIELGLSTVVDTCRLHLENQHGNVNKNEFENSLLLHPESIFFAGESYDLREIKEHVVYQNANSIMTGIRRKWADKTQYIRNTFIFGGGAIDLGKHLGSLSATPYEIPNNPDEMNMLGYSVMDSM